jgi:hypothetical protein
MKMKIAERNLKLIMERQTRDQLCGSLHFWSTTQPRVLDNTENLHAWQLPHKVTM